MLKKDWPMTKGYRLVFREYLNVYHIDFEDAWGRQLWANGLNVLTLYKW